MIGSRDHLLSENFLEFQGAKQSFYIAQLVGLENKLYEVYECFRHSNSVYDF